MARTAAWHAGPQTWLLPAAGVLTAVLLLWLVLSSSAVPEFVAKQHTAAGTRLAASVERLHTPACPQCPTCPTCKACPAPPPPPPPPRYHPKACRPDGEGTWAIGIFRGPSPLNLTPAAGMAADANPILTCASVLDPPSNFGVGQAVGGA